MTLEQRIKATEELTGFKWESNLEIFFGRSEQLSIKVYKGRWAKHGPFILGRVMKDSGNSQWGIPVKWLKPLAEIWG